MSRNGDGIRASGGTCVLLVARDDEAPRALLDALDDRDIEVLECRSAWRAMADLCLLNQLAPHRAISLLIVRPQGIGDAAMLHASARRYIRALTIWQFDGPSNPGLRRVVQEDVQTWRGQDSNPAKTAPRQERSTAQLEHRPPSHPAVSAQHVAQRPTHGEGSTLRLAGDGPLPAGEPARDEHESDDERDDSQRTTDLLTEAELAMLLGDDDIDDQTRTSNR